MSESSQLFDVPYHPPPAYPPLNISSLRKSPTIEYRTMSSIFTPQNLLISRGSFILNNSEAHYHGLRHAFLSKYFLCETHVFLKSIDGSDILHRATATHNSKERFDPPKCHLNTRLAVLANIMKWIEWEGELNAFIMWVYGPAGVGRFKNLNPEVGGQLFLCNRHRTPSLNLYFTLPSTFMDIFPYFY